MAGFNPELLTSEPIPLTMSLSFLGCEMGGDRVQMQCLRYFLALKLFSPSETLHGLASSSLFPQVVGKLVTWDPERSSLKKQVCVGFLGPPVEIHSPSEA